MGGQGRSPFVVHIADLAPFLQVQSVWPHHSASFCHCPLCRSTYFEGTLCHKDTDIVLSNDVVLIHRCIKCQWGVPFMCGHNSCLPRQIE